MIAQDRYKSAMAAAAATAAAAAAAVDATGRVGPLFPSSSSPSRRPPRAHRVKAIGGRWHHAFRSRHVPMLFDSPFVLPYHWPAKGNKKESGSTLQPSPFVKLSDLVERTSWSEIFLRIYFSQLVNWMHKTLTNSYVIFKNFERDTKFISHRSYLLFIYHFITL